MTRLKKIMALMMISVMVFAFLGCGKKSLEGTWTGNLSNGSEVSFTFEKDGSGVYSKGGIALSCTYKTEGDQLTFTMTYLGQSQDETYTYEIKSNELTMTSSSGDSFTLTKSK